MRLRFPPQQSYAYEHKICHPQANRQWSDHKQRTTLENCPIHVLEHKQDKHPLPVRFEPQCRQDEEAYPNPPRKHHRCNCDGEERDDPFMRGLHRRLGYSPVLLTGAASVDSACGFVIASSSAVAISPSRLPSSLPDSRCPLRYTVGVAKRAPSNVSASS